MLFMPERHTALAAPAWDEAIARAAIQAIVDDACERFDPLALWPPHPGDADEGHPDRPLIPLYFGAAGVVWAQARAGPVPRTAHPSPPPARWRKCRRP